MGISPAVGPSAFPRPDLALRGEGLRGRGGGGGGGGGGVAGRVPPTISLRNVALPRDRGHGHGRFKVPKIRSRVMQALTRGRYSTVNGEAPRLFLAPHGENAAMCVRPGRGLTIQSMFYFGKIRGKS